MASKTISVTEEIYELLITLKLPHESFGEVIKRLCKEKSAESLSKWVDSQALWSDMDNSELEPWCQIGSKRDSTFTVNEVNFE